MYNSISDKSFLGLSNRLQNTKLRDVTYVTRLTTCRCVTYVTYVTYMTYTLLKINLKIKFIITCMLNTASQHKFTLNTASQHNVVILKKKSTTC